MPATAKFDRDACAARALQRDRAPERATTSVDWHPRTARGHDRPRKALLTVLQTALHACLGPSSLVPNSLLAHPTSG